MGKTRLACELAGRAARAYQSGARLVELAPIGEAALVPSAVAAVLGVAEQPGVPMTDTIVAALAAEELLLVLDNCEHVVAACLDLITSLRRGCPTVTVLATSREALRLADDDVVVRVEGLSCPEAAQTSSVAELLQSDAVQLFVDRARASAPDFELTLGNAADITAVCQRLEGAPLAIELAARTIPLLTPGQVAAHMADRLSMLVVGARTAQRRHQSLRAAIEWSYDLLTPDEQEAFRRLSVFTAGFEPDAATAVLDADPATVTEVLARLTAKSLLTAANARPDATRLRMLESTRLYGLEQLCARGEEDETFDRLVGWLTDLARPLVDAVTLDKTIFDRLGAEHDNIVPVLARMGEGTDERQLLIASGLAMVRLLRRVVGDLDSILTRAAAATDPESRDRGLALGHAARLTGWRGDGDTAVRLARQALSLELRNDRPNVRARLTRILATALLVCGDRAGHDAAMMETIRISRPLGDPIAVAMPLANLAWTAVGAGDLDRAAELLDEALPILRTLGTPYALAAALHTAGALAVDRGDLSAAEAHFAAAIRSWDSPMDLAFCCEGLARVATRTGRPTRALRLIAAAQAIHARDDGDPDEPWWVARVASAAADATAALPRDRAAEATTTGAALDHGDVVEYALHDVWPEPDVPAVTAGSPLGEQEWRLARLIAEGLSNKQIASRLKMSLRTVNAQVGAVRAKLGVRSRTHIAAWVAQHADGGHTL